MGLTKREHNKYPALPESQDAQSVESAEDFAERASLRTHRLVEGIRERDALIRKQALEEAVRDMNAFYWEEHKKRLNEYQRIPTGYDEGIMDGLDMAEQRIRALAAQERGGS